MLEPQVAELKCCPKPSSLRALRIYSPQTPCSLYLSCGVCRPARDIEVVKRSIIVPSCCVIEPAGILPGHHAIPGSLIPGNVELYICSCVVVFCVLRVSV